MGALSEPCDLTLWLDHIAQRHRQRCLGMTDAEFSWRPAPDADLCLDWRLFHLADLLTAERNSSWLGAPCTWEPATRKSTAAEALAQVEAGYEAFSGVINAIPDAEWGQLMGPVAGPFAASSKRAFVLHIFDELIHHQAEVALLRDLYGAR